MTTELINQQRDLIAELEREKVELLAKIEASKVLLSQCADLVNVDAGTAIDWLIANSYDLEKAAKSTPDQCLNQIKAEAVRKFSSELASRVEVPDSSAQKIEYYKAAIRHVLQFADQYAANIYSDK